LDMSADDILTTLTEMTALTERGVLRDEAVP